jgi:hypothetical protein
MTPTLQGSTNPDRDCYELEFTTIFFTFSFCLFYMGQQNTSFATIAAPSFAKSKAKSATLATGYFFYLSVDL